MAINEDIIPERNELGLVGETWLIKNGDLVLGNPTLRIKPWSRVPYRWVRIQKPNNSRLWATIAGRGI